MDRISLDFLSTFHGLLLVPLSRINLLEIRSSCSDNKTMNRAKRLPLDYIGCFHVFYPLLGGFRLSPRHFTTVRVS